MLFESRIALSISEQLSRETLLELLLEFVFQFNEDKAEVFLEDKLNSPVDTINDYRAFFVSNGKLMIAEHLKSVEREVVTAALVAAEDDIDIAARMLHLSVAELVEKKQDLGIRTKPS